MVRTVAGGKGLSVWTRAAGFALLLAAAALLVLPSHASASAPQIGVLLEPGGGGGKALPTSPIPTITDQSTVEVRVPVNTTLTPGDSVKILECSDADGETDDLPTSAEMCDGLTIDTGRTIDVGQGGTVDKTDYEIYVLPSAALDEPKDQIPVCNATSACVLYIGQDQNDFTQPHVWSQPFHVGCVTSSAQCGLPTTTSTTTPATTTPATTTPATATPATATSATAAPPSTGSADPGSGVGVSETSSGPPGVLASTGTPGAVIWMAAGGAILLVLGSVGRQRLAALPR